MTRLRQLFEEQGQSPWLDNLKRAYLTGGRLAQLRDGGIRGVTSNPTIFQKAIAGQPDYDDQFKTLVEHHETVEDAYWDLVVDDVSAALDTLAPIHAESGGSDGFVSIELDPAMAHDCDASVGAARHLHDRIDRPNLLVKIPATDEGVTAVQRMIAEGRSINITLIFSLERYDEVIEAYLAGLEEYDGDLSKVNSVASFFVSRVDTEVDRRLTSVGSDDAKDLRGRAAVAQAKLAYELFRDRFSGRRWEHLAARGARLQRPLWASTSTKNPDLPDTLYVDSLIGPDTVNTMPDATIDAFEDHGTVAPTIDAGVDEAHDVMTRLDSLGVDMADVASVLEDEGAAAFVKSFQELMTALADKAGQLSAGG